MRTVEERRRATHRMLGGSRIGEGRTHEVNKRKARQWPRRFDLFASLKRTI
jgi:hypothetical protein